MKQRDVTVDALKGLAILLVILGHAIQWNIPAFDYNIYFRVIYSFHMPLFMFLSGYIAWNHPVNLLRKVRTLVVPFVAWYILDFLTTGDVLSTNFVTYIIRWVKSPDWGLWFLWILLLCFVILRIVLFIPKRYAEVGLISIIVMCLLASKYLHFYLYGIPLLIWYFPFFAIGFLIARYKNTLSAWTKPFQLSSVFIFPLLVSQWMRAEPPLFYPTYNQWFINHHLHGFYFTILLYRYLTSFFGITLSFYLIKLIVQTWAYRLFCRMGLISLDIYVIHLSFLTVMNPGFGTGFFKIASTFLIALSVALILSPILKRYPILNMLFLGGRMSAAHKTSNPSNMAHTV